MRMARFWTWLLLLLGGLLFSLTLIRTLQPRQSVGLYQVVYGDLHGLQCCAAYLINEPRHQANRVRVGLIKQDEDDPSNVSPSGDWKFVNVLVSLNNTYRAYFIPTDGRPPMALPPQVGDGWYAHWDGQQDVLYYFAREGLDFESALFRISPSEPQPVRLSNYMFGLIRTFQQQPLPTTHFSPWALLFISINLLVIALPLRQWQAK
jgi:hypothetical protein